MIWLRPMAKRLDHVLVIDVESTCWAQHPPRGQFSEIIEVGLCVLDLASLERIEKRCLLVRPASSEVSEFCTQLTGITAQMLEDALPLSAAVRVLSEEYRSRERLFASWGDYDRKQFQRNCTQYGLDYPFGPTHLNVKNLFAAALGLPKEPGLDSALEKFGLSMEGSHHRGVDDAWNIARLLAVLLRRIRLTRS